MDIAEMKKQQRNIVKEKQNTITAKEKELWDNSIREKLFSLNEYKKANVIFCFVSIDKEIDTINIIEKMLSDGKTVCVPKCISKGVMRAYKISGLSQLSKGKYGIQEPKEECEEVDKNKIDLAVVPCVSADKNLGRLGHGGGYYDRFMQDSRFFKLLICYERLLFQSVYTDEHDVKCDILITDENIYHKN